MITAVYRIFSRLYWSLRMRFWLWRENRALGRFQRRSVELTNGRLLAGHSTPGPPSLEETRFITEMADQLRLQPLIFGDGKKFIKAIGNETPLEEQPLSVEPVKSQLRSRKQELIAGYDAHFLASIRIKSSVHSKRS